MDTSTKSMNSINIGLTPDIRMRNAMLRPTNPQSSWIEHFSQILLCGTFWKAWNTTARLFFCMFPIVPLSKLASRAEL